MFERLTNLEHLWLWHTPGEPFNPVANAGADQTVQLGAAVTLSGSTGESPWGSNVTYAWTQVDASDPPLTPATVTLTGAGHGHAPLHRAGVGGRTPFSAHSHRQG